ncbi:hypothetical protein DKL61_06720 [Gammaproteobacteria bacterium ESL0073]|nr:hypothetical protein DKL61_06720 [Gammaproteobacteria bacterium ESL0073]
MKQLIIGIVLAVCLVGCGEKPKFSISEGDTSEVYANNPAFTKIKISLIIDGKEENDGKGDKFGYQFTAAPISVNGIETGDLNVIGGTLVIPPAGQKGTNITLTIKGKEGFDKLEKRINELKEFACSKVNIGNVRTLNCQAEQQRGRVIITTTYNPFSDISSFMYMKY